MRFWMDMGVDGMRLDAIPYLCVREGTNNENLPETHAVLKRMRAAMDAEYTGRMFLAEANQWPEDVREYFGDGDECHMAYHFPLMPRIFMAVALEDRYPVAEIMRQTPDIPDNCQWAIFLRNHDELTLEMVTDRERDYMYRMYAQEPRMRVNVGIRRRLAPLLEQRRRSHQADEQPAAVDAGLADHLLRRRDRHGRQHLHRRPQRRAHADAVEHRSQRRLLARRSAAAVPAGDHGSDLRLSGRERRSAEPRSRLAAQLDAPHPRRAHASISASAAARWNSCGRRTARSSRTCARSAAEIVLCVANLSQTAQAVELDLSKYKGRVPVELMGRNAFPPIGDLPYFLTLAAHGFFWMLLERFGDAAGVARRALARDRVAGAGAVAGAGDVPGGQRRRSRARPALRGARASNSNRKSCRSSCGLAAGSLIDNGGLDRDASRAGIALAQRAPHVPAVVRRRGVRRHAQALLPAARAGLGRRPRTAARCAPPSGLSRKFASMRVSAC